MAALRCLPKFEVFLISIPSVFNMSSSLLLGRLLVMDLITYQAVFVLLDN
jgi:hypothetical protein